MTERPDELAALYLSGAMTPEEQRAIEARVAAGETELIRALEHLAPVGRLLAEAGPSPIDPDPATRDTVLAAIRGRGEDEHQVWRDWRPTATESELFTLPADEGGWEETGVPGITVRRLFVDRANNRMTALFRMEPGTAYVPHVHDGPEECYVLEGDLHVGDDVVMHAGDYQRAPAGSTHGVQRTEGGCVLLIASSLSDELI